MGIWGGVDIKGGYRDVKRAGFDRNRLVICLGIGLGMVVFISWRYELDISIRYSLFSILLDNSMYQ